MIFFLVAPEVLLGKKNGYKSDTWSIGVILFVFLSGGFLPFYGEDEYQVESKEKLIDGIIKGNWTYEPKESWEKVSINAKDLVSKLLTTKPSNRLDYKEILKHPWFNSIQL